MIDIEAYQGYGSSSSTSKNSGHWVPSFECMQIAETNPQSSFDKHKVIQETPEFLLKVSLSCALETWVHSPLCVAYLSCPSELVKTGCCGQSPRISRAEDDRGKMLELGWTKRDFFSKKSRPRLLAWVSLLLPSNKTEREMTLRVRQPQCVCPNHYQSSSCPWASETESNHSWNFASFLERT